MSNVRRSLATTVTLAILLPSAIGGSVPTAYAQASAVTAEQSHAEPSPLPDARVQAPPQAGPQPGDKPAPLVQPSVQPSTPSDVAVPAAPEAGGKPVVVEVDPVIALVRQRLAERSKGPVVERGDRDALAAFYAFSGRTPLWSANGELTRRARDTVSEIGRADEWGLVASAFELPDPKLARASEQALADAEIKLSAAVLKYARHARGGRVDPRVTGQSLDQKPNLLAPGVVMQAIATTEKPDVYLRSLHPKHPQFQSLRVALMKLRTGKPIAAAAQPALAQGPDLRPGVVHPQIAEVRRRLGVRSAPGRETYYDATLADAVQQIQEQHRLRPDGVITSATRTVLNPPARGGASHSSPMSTSDIQRILINMERWRWMPPSLGDLHVWDNIPEYQTRIVKKDQTIHSAKIIAGKVDTQTPVFSANMRQVIFHPEWGVPDSIKTQELLPSLRPQQGYGYQGRTDTQILKRHNLRVAYNGQPVDPATVDWSQVDIRRFTFIQPAGPQNVLGVVKFSFPNRHDIYMHDTPERFLFEKQSRVFSHGCMRVENPVRFAEVILGQDKGWSPAQVAALVADQATAEIALSRQIPVHVTYFTAVAGADGIVKFTGDPYGKDVRLASSLAGQPVQLNIPQEVIERQVADARRARPRQQTSAATPFDIFSGLFGN